MSHNKNRNSHTLIEGWEIQSKYLKDKFPKLLDEYLHRETEQGLSLLDRAQKKLSRGLAKLLRA